MGVSSKTKKALKKAVKQKKHRRRGSWLFIERGDTLREVFSKLLTQFAVLVLAACGVIFVNEARLSFTAKTLNKDLRVLYNTYIGDIAENIGELTGGGKKQLLPGAEKLLEINPDTVGYIVIDGTDISLPVVQRTSPDGNEYYLKTAFDGSVNKAGTIFLDFRAKLGADKRSDVLTLYGHNQRDLTMFGELKSYKGNVDFYKSHPVITFYSNYEKDTYKIFGYFVTEVLPEQTKDGKVFRYHNFIDLDRSSYEEFVSNIELRSQIITGVDVKYGDEFLTLSTCSNEFEPSRFVVFARKTRKGEDETVDTSQAVLNPSAKEPDWNVIYGKVR
ncbi:MAG: class B sortase [Oscillospiraceae bacterium]|nr:class B sortase [Oscillospiraceae bacterium]